MTKNTHVFVAVAAVMPFTTTLQATIYIPVAIAASIIPDFDFFLGLEHRTITHSLLLMTILVAPMFIIDKTLALYFFIGYLSHLILDYFTVMGVPWFYPFNKKKYSLNVCHTRDSIDLYVRLIAIFFITIYLTQ